MSKLETNTIDTVSGTSTLQVGSTNTSTITLGVSGDTINVPSGVTIANSGTATGFGGNMTPAFMGRNASIQAVSENTLTKLNATTEILDTNNAYASSRFTPGVAGNYYIFAGAYLNAEGNDNLEVAGAQFYFNGSALAGTFSEINFRNNDAYAAMILTSTIKTFDTDDYIELYGQLEAHDNTGGVSNVGTFFGGYKIIE
jgi:hypothetical protein